ncbi:LacI family DNA-binding transcriptional regulator [Variovorax sp. J22P271]|uniref:LacI family DNA-binding transcriptional regulator n=1 Tax=Variovorax davisae TaxID=3053515 RepID=UPI00257654A8|nr:LacI family DNA-binding transcriptional regulator [Variovorax sp. J22P271]MDM0036153.1 LacI family DNA-binding transcriptional regulator [Variovorax sp. J22P271]
MSAAAPAPRPARVTIADVAKAAGVSKATVSRFLNHRERLLSPDIAARVEAAVTKLAYTPSPMAQALSHGRSRLIGLIVADITNPYSVAVLRGAEKACQDAGYLVMLFNLGNDIDREREAINALAGYQVDGFILNTLGRGAGLVDADALHGKPAVLVDRRHAGMHTDFVSLDNAAAMQAACGHLVDGGYRELLYITEPQKGVSSRRERTAAFGDCVAAHEPRVAGEVYESTGDDGDGLDAALRALHKRAQRGKRVAVLAGNAVVTLRVAAAMARLGLRFGADIGFVGFDDAEWAPLIGPGLSAVAQPTEAIGRTAATCLLERLQGLEGPARQLLLPGVLVVRGSSSAG